MSAWRITFDRGTAYLAGPKSEARRRLAACGDSSPIWSRRTEAWATSPAVAARVVEQLDARRIAVAIEDTAQHALDLTETTPANVLPDRGLW